MLEIFNNGNQLQNFISFLDYFEGKGITDPHTIKAYCQDLLRSEKGNIRLSKSEKYAAKKYQKHIQELNAQLAKSEKIRNRTMCPSCGEEHRVLRKTYREGHAYETCAEKKNGAWVVGCGYSVILKL